MKEQTHIIKNQNSFNLKHIFECGQCFRWEKQKDESYTGIFNNTVLNVKQNGKTIIFTGISDKKIISEIKEYFNLEKNYVEIKKQLGNIDQYLSKSIQFGEGIRILKQDLWETLISFIISANNNIPRIKKIIEKLSKTYGKKITWQGQDYYTFPTPQELSKASIEDLRKLGLGFRDKRIYETTKIINEKKELLDQIKNEKNFEKQREQLLQFPGVGPKVADCILLFALNKYEAFPIDVWVKKVMSEIYFSQEATPKQIEELAKNKYGKLAGIAQQYLFYWKRETA